MSLFRKKKISVPTGEVFVGKVHGLGARENQQDAYAVSGTDGNDGGILAVVADGMGGLVNSGELSAGIVDAMMDAYAPGGDLPAPVHLQLLLKRTIEAAADMTSGQAYQSGSTLVACMVQQKVLSWIAVGDSRIYLWRSGGMIQLNRDHDFAHDLTVMAIHEQVSFEDAQNNPRKGALTSFIGREFPRYIDFNPEPLTLMLGDRIILMSDGVYRTLSERELSKYLCRPAENCAKMISRRIRLKKMPHQDNFTAVILEIQ